MLEEAVEEAVEDDAAEEVVEDALLAAAAGSADFVVEESLAPAAESPDVEPERLSVR